MTKSRNVVGASTYQRIKRDIIFGDLAPGSKLKLDGLRERYAASMSTLRETLNRLASEGFVDIQVLASRIDHASASKSPASKIPMGLSRPRKATIMAVNP